MRRSVLFSLLIVFWMGNPTNLKAQQRDTNSIEKTKREVLEVEHELDRAALKGAESNLDAIFADHLVWLTSAGEFLTKTQAMASIRAGQQEEFPTKPEDIQLHVYGNTVVLFGTVSERYKPKTKGDAPLKTVTNVFVRRDGRWKIIAHGSTLVEK